MGNNDYRSLIEQSISGDEDAFNSLFTAVRPMASFYARSIAKDAYIADEAVQMSAIRMYQSLSSLRDPDAFEGWFKRIVRNETLQLLTKYNKEINFTALDNEEDDLSFEYSIADEKIENQPELKFSQSEKERMINEIISSLPDDQRTPIMLYFFEGLKIREIADTLNVNENTIKTRLTAAKKSIKSKVEFIQKRDGIKLYSASPLGFFLWLLQGYGEGAGISTLVLGTTATTTATIAATAASTAGEIGLKTVAANLMASTASKIISSTIVLSLVAGGGYAVMKNITEKEPVTDVQEETTESIPVQTTEETTEETVEEQQPEETKQETGQKGHYETITVLVSEAWDEQVLVKEGWTEMVVVTEAWDEVITDTNTCAVWETKYKDCVQCANCGQIFDYEDYSHYHGSEETVWIPVTVPDGEICTGYATTTIHHDATYKEVWHEPEYKTVHHDAVYETQTVWVND